MFKSVLMGSILLFGINSLADSALKGTWCKRSDDFTQVLKIDSSGDLETFAVGNQAGEKTPSQKGYVSEGASAFQMVIEGEDEGYVDFEIKNGLLGGRKTLRLFKAQGGTDKFKSCKI